MPIPGGGPCIQAIPAGPAPGGGGGGGGPKANAQTNRDAAAPPSAPTPKPASPAATTAGVEWRRGGRAGSMVGGCGAGAGLVGVVGFVSLASWLSMVMIATLGTELEVELKKLRVRHRRQRRHRYDARRGRLGHAGRRLDRAGVADRRRGRQLWIRRRRKLDPDFPGDAGQREDRKRADRQTCQPGEDHHDGRMAPAGVGGTGVAGGQLAPIWSMDLKKLACFRLISARHINNGS
jgi:hypothetical protein